MRVTDGHTRFVMLARRAERSSGCLAALALALASACAPGRVDGTTRDAGADARVDAADVSTSDASTADSGLDSRVDAGDASQIHDLGILEDVAVTYVDAGACETAGYTFRNNGDSGPPDIWFMGVGDKLFCDELWVSFPAGAGPFIAPYFAPVNCTPLACSSYGPWTWNIAFTQPWTTDMVRDLCQVEAQFGVLDWSCILQFE